MGLFVQCESWAHLNSGCLSAANASTASLQNCFSQFFCIEGSTTQTTIGLPDGTAIVVDDADEFVDRTGGLPPPGSRSAHICKLTADSNTARVKKCNFDRVIARTVHAWAVPVDELEESESHIAYQIKCTILEAFLGFSSLNMGDERTQFELDTDQGMDGPLSDVSGNGSVEPFNPSKLVATELLAPTWQVLLLQVNELLVLCFLQSDSCAEIVDLFWWLSIFRRTALG